MSEHFQELNRFIVKIESGHPGYQNTTILSTAVDFSQLAEELRALARKGEGRFEQQVGHRESLVFEVVSGHELAALQEKGFWARCWESYVGCFLFFLIIPGLAVYGLVMAIVQLTRGAF